SQMFFRFDGRRAQANALGLQRDFRQPEVENFRLSTSGHENVCRFDVTMDDSFRMCRVQGIRDLDTQIEHRLDLQWLAIDLMPERLPLQQFHRNEGPSINLVNFVDRAYIRVIEGRSGAGLTAESL